MMCLLLSQTEFPIKVIYALKYFNCTSIIYYFTDAPVVVISQTTSSFDGQGRQSINIPCSYMSNPAATSVFWTKYNPVAGTNSGNTKLVEIDGNKYQGANLNSPSLTIYNLDRSDAGSYRCSASNIIGLGESNYVTLNIDTNGEFVFGYFFRKHD